MSLNYNMVILGGRLTRDVEVRTAPSGDTMATCCIAVNSRRRDGSDEALFMEFVAYGARADALSKHCRKGTSLLIEGRLKVDKWNDKSTGKPVSRTKLELNHWSFEEPRGGQGAGEGPEEPSGEAAEGTGGASDQPF